MHFECPLAEIRDACLALASVVPTRSPKTELLCFYLAAKDGGLLLRACDLELFVETVVPGIEIRSPGDVLLPARELGQILRELAVDRVSFELESNSSRVVIRAGRDIFKLVAQPSDNFPLFPEARGVEVTIPGAELERMIRQTEFATAQESRKYALNGVLFHFEPTALRLVATDGRRLAVSSCEGSCPQKVYQVVPLKALGQVQKLLRTGAETVSLRVSDSEIGFDIGTSRLFSRLIEGRFPEYSSVIPTQLALPIQIDREAFMQVARKAALFTNANSSTVRFQFGNNQMTLSSSLPELGESTIVMDIDAPGPVTDIGFNPQYLIDALKVIREDTIVFEVENASKPGMIRIGETYLYVAMPMML